MGDWSALPAELLCIISDSLGLVDYVQFGAVCAPWRQAVIGRRHHPPLRPQPPWLMSVPRSGAEPTAADFFCPADGRTYRLDLPEPPVRRRMPIGSADGWLVTADEVAEMHLLNPITGVQVRLPSILTLPIIDAVRDADGHIAEYVVQYGPTREPHPVALEEARECLHGKVVLSHPPFSDWTAVVMFALCSRLAFARAGERVWTFLPEPRGCVDDVMYHKGQFYALENFTGRAIAWDLTGPSPRSAYIGSPLSGLLDYNPSNKYLVESGGDLLQVWRKRFVEGETMRTVAFHVFRLDEKEQTWVGMKSLGERALFLGLNSSMSLSTLEYPELKRNCIYFTEDFWDLVFSCPEGECDMGVFNLEDETIEPCCPYNHHLNWPPPVWIMPRLF